MYELILFLAIRELLPEIITHLGPKQLGALKDLGNSFKKPDQIDEKNEEDEEDIPSLVNKNFEKAEEK